MAFNTSSETPAVTSTHITTTSSSSSGQSQRLGDLIISGLGGGSSTVTSTSSNSTLATSATIQTTSDGVPLTTGTLIETYTYGNESTRTVTYLDTTYYNTSLPRTGSGKIPSYFRRIDCLSTVPQLPGTYGLTAIANADLGSKYASECNNLLQSYTFASVTGQKYYTDYTTTTYTNYTAQIITLCDGFPRVNGTLTPTATGVTSVANPTQRNYTGSPPDCSINPSDCAALFQSWTSVLSSIDSATNAAITTLSLASNAETFYVNNATATLATVASVTSPPAITFNGTVYFANAGTSYNFSGDILTPGGEVEVFGANFTEFLDLPNEPLCSRTQGPASECGGCIIYGGTVQLIYFPVPANVSRNMCASGPVGSATVCPFGPTTAPLTGNSDPYVAEPCSYAPMNMSSTEDSGPYVVANGTTFYKNRAYISVATAYASNSCGYVGGVHTGELLTLASSKVFTVRGYHYEFLDAAYSFNFADLNDPVPASAYFGLDAGDACEDDEGASSIWGFNDFINGQSADQGEGPCGTIYDQAYNPVLAVPPELRSIDPAWSTCALNLVGLYDPPRALTQELTVDTPTVSFSTSASPAPTALPVTVSATSTPIPTTPSSTSAPTSSPSSVDSSTEAFSTSVDSFSAPPSSTDKLSSSDIVVTVKSSDQGSSASETSTIDAPATTSAVGSSDTGSAPDGAQSTVSSTDPGGIIASLLDNSSPGETSATAPSTFQSQQGSTVLVGAISGTAPTTIGTLAVSAAPNSHDIVIGTQTFAPGETTDINNTPVSVATGAIVIGTTPGSSAATSGQASPLKSNDGVLTVAGQTYTAHSSDGVIILGSATLTPGGVATLQSGHVVSAASSDLVIDGSSTLEVPAAASPALASSDPSVTGDVVVNSQTFQPSVPTTIGTEPAVLTNGVVVYGTGTAASTLFINEASNAVVIGSQTVTAGAMTTINNTPVSVGTGGVVVVGSQTLTLSQGPVTFDGVTISEASATSPFAADPTSEITLTVGSQVLTGQESVQLDGSTVVALGSTILTVGGQATSIDGTVVSAGSGGLVVGDTTTVAFTSLESPSLSSRNSDSGSSGITRPTATAASTAATATATSGVASRSLVGCHSIVWVFIGLYLMA